MRRQCCNGAIVLLFTYLTPGSCKTLAAPAGVDRDLPRLGQGFVWQDLSVGQSFRTFRRTITETDLVNFIGVTGMLEAIFIEDGYEVLHTSKFTVKRKIANIIYY